MTRKRFFHPEDLTALRERCDWRRLLDELGIRADVRRCTETEVWGFSPFHPDEKTASFHMKAPGVWYDWSSHARAPGRDKPGGGVIELVQAVHAARGQVLKLNEAAAWIVDRGLGPADLPSQASPPPAAEPTAPQDPVPENRPITIDLVPHLSDQGTHPAFVQRDMTAATCRYLRCGVLTGRRGPLAGRVVFQIGGLDEGGTGRVILSHMGRATTPEQDVAGKWRFYRGFNPSLELYNIDNLVLDPEAARQARETRTVLVVEGAFDVAKCVEAGIRNVVATFGARLHAAQARRLRQTLPALSAARILVFYDRDAAGRKAATEALALLTEHGLQAAAFDWDQDFAGRDRRPVPIPEAIRDPCDFSLRQLRWMRQRGIV